MATETTIRAAIKAKLDAITELAFVNDKLDENITGFPAAIFDLVSEDNIFLTNKENLKTMVFNIVIYQEIGTLGKDDAKRILDVTVNKVVDAFDNDFNLGGEVDWCIPVRGDRGQANTSSGAAYGQELQISCRFTKLTT